MDDSDGSVVPSVVNTTGAGDAIILTPSAPLKPDTSYTFNVTAGVRDAAGTHLTPYSSTFTTGAAAAPVDPGVAFTKVSLPVTAGVAYSDVKVGPDHRVYASSEDGRIFRFPVNADGTLGDADVITSLQDANGGARLVSGFAFDPASTAANVVLWVSNGYYGFDDAPDWTGKITRMSGPDLRTVQDVVVGLPRSVRDHLTEQPCFGPDGALYFCQASNSSMGAADDVWGDRPERELSAAVLRLDVTKITPGKPINVVTPDGGGTYDPYAAGRAADDLRHRRAQHLRPALVAGGHPLRPEQRLLGRRKHARPSPPQTPRPSTAPAPTPGAYAGPDVPGLTDVSDTEPDFVFRITQGKYYGHPDPARGEYVLNDGNPGAASAAATRADPDAVVPEYPAGTQPDANYAGYDYDLGLHRSPDGAIEYSGKQAFGGQLNNQLLVAEYSGGGDVVALTRDASGNITGAVRGIAGLSGFDNPISLTEDPGTGDLYVSELGAKKLTLLVPVPGNGATASPAPVVAPTPPPPVAPAPTPVPTPPASSTPPAAPDGGRAGQGGVGGEAGTGNSPAPSSAPPSSPPPAATPGVRPMPYQADTLIVLSDQQRLARDRGNWETALAADKRAVKAAESAVRAAQAAERQKARTARHDVVLAAAVRTQVAADQARARNVVAAAEAKLKADQFSFVHAILADTVRLRADRRKLPAGKGPAPKSKA